MTSRAVQGGIQVTGLTEFRASVKAVEDGKATAVKAIFNEVSAVVVAAAKYRTPVRSGRLQESIRAASTTTMARISMGGAAAPYAGFIDYGNTVHAGRGVGRGDSQPRRFTSTGRIMYPAYLSKRDEIIPLANRLFGEYIETKGIGVTNGQ